MKFTFSFLIVSFLLLFVNISKAQSESITYVITEYSSEFDGEWFDFTPEGGKGAIRFFPMKDTSFCLWILKVKNMTGMPTWMRVPIHMI